MPSTSSEIPDVIASPEVMELDPGRARIRMRLADLSALTPAQESPDGGGTRGQETVPDPGLVPDTASLVDTFTRPGVLIDIETSSPAGLVTHAIALRGQSSWSMTGWPGTDEVEFAPVDPGLLVPAIALIVGLRRHPGAATPDEDADGATLTLPAPLLDRALSLRQNARHPVAPELTAAILTSLEDLAPPLTTVERGRLNDLVTGFRVFWRVTVTAHPYGLEPGEPQLTGTVTVVDAGPAGLWRRLDDAGTAIHRGAAEPDDITLERTTPGQVWRDLTEAVEDLTAGPSADATAADPAPRHP